MSRAELTLMVLVLAALALWIGGGRVIDPTMAAMLIVALNDVELLRRRSVLPSTLAVKPAAAGSLELSSASRELDHLATLLRERLARVALPSAVIEIALVSIVDWPI